MNKDISTHSSCVLDFVRINLRGAGQVMWQNSSWTGLLFLIGIFWGGYREGSPLVAWGALAGLVSSTLTGMILKLPQDSIRQGLYGFNGILVGAACMTFLGNTPWVWLTLAGAAAASTWIMVGFNNITNKFGVPAFTFPFVFVAWIIMLSAYRFGQIHIESMGPPSLPAETALSASFHLTGEFLTISWLKGIGQVFLINSWIAGLFFLAGLAVSNWRAALWAAIGSAVALLTVILLGANPSLVENGLYGFSPVLTAIGLATVYYKTSVKSTIWAILGIVATVFIQGAMDTFFSPLGVPTFTGPFCVATWLFLLPQFHLDPQDKTEKP